MNLVKSHLCRTPALPRETLGDGRQAGLERRTLAARVFSDDSGWLDAWSLGCCCWEIVGSPTGITGERTLWPGAVRGLHRYFPLLRHQAVNCATGSGHLHPGISLLESSLFLFPVSVFSCLLPNLMLFFFLLFSLYTYFGNYIWSVLVVISL